MSDKAVVAVVSFLVGALIGAVVALFLAPMSGRELQYRVRREAEADWQKIRAEYYKNLGDLQRSFERRIDEVKGQVASIRGGS